MIKNNKSPEKGAFGKSSESVQPNEIRAKYTKYQREVKEVKAFLTKHTATQTMASVELDIYRPNLCRIKRELQDQGVLVEVRKGICQETGHRASYLTCNPKLIQEIKKGGSLDA